MEAPWLLELLLAQPLLYYSLYWAILVAAALCEALQPGREFRTPNGPRFVVNFGFGLITMAVYSLPFLSEIALAQLALAQQWGLLNRIDLPVLAKIGLGFLAYDLCGYTLHRLSHHVDWLWRLHRVHHADADLDISTYFRSHPLDVLVIVLIKYALIVSLGVHPAAMVLHGLAKQVTMTLGHAGLRPWPKLSAIAGLLFVTPRFHSTHHSSHRPQTDSNYGEVLTIWDRLLGSTCRDETPIRRFGLGDRYDRDSASLAAQLKLPFVER